MTPEDGTAVLIIGMCGVGKTWVMTQLLEGEAAERKQIGLVHFHECRDRIVVGKYDGTMFQGSDRLSMAVMRSVDDFMRYARGTGKVAIFEGDRFTNSKFIGRADPMIVRIEGDGRAGRQLRGSVQSERHLKSIATRVRNVASHHDCEDSSQALERVRALILRRAHASMTSLSQ